jgi:hypothetical protein
MVKPDAGSRDEGPVRVTPREQAPAQLERNVDLLNHLYYLLGHPAATVRERPPRRTASTGAAHAGR